MNVIEQLGGKIHILKFSLILVAIMAALIFPMFILLRLVQQQDGIPQRRGVEIVPIIQVNNNEQKIVLSGDNVTVYIPEDTTDLPGNFVLSPRQPNLFSFAGTSEWSRPLVVNIEYRNEDGVNYPGITFSKPISVCFIMTPDQWNDFTKRPNDFQVQYYDDGQFPSRWTSLPLTKDPERSELCGLTDHFSIFALAMKPPESIPVTGPTLNSVPTANPTSTDFVPTVERLARSSEDNTATPIPTATATKPPATQTPLPTQTTQPTSTPQPTQTTQPTSTPLPTSTLQPTQTPQHTKTPPGKPTPTLTPEPPTPTDPPPTATNQPQPTATDQPQPTATDQPQPTATNQPQPTATNPPQPTATNPPPPTATNPPPPTATNPPPPPPTATDPPPPPAPTATDPPPA